MQRFTIILSPVEHLFLRYDLALGRIPLLVKDEMLTVPGKQSFLSLSVSVSPSISSSDLSLFSDSLWFCFSDQED